MTKNVPRRCGRKDGYAKRNKNDRNTLAGGDRALLFGNSGVIANVLDSYSVSEETLDVWRAEGDNFIRSWEDRFVLDTGYFNILPDKQQ